jgi:ribonuclease HI
VDDEGENITLLWVPAHMERPGNETVVEEIKTALEENFLQELINWIKTEALNKKNMAKK